MKKPGTSSSSFLDQPEFRASLRFLCRIFWLLFIHSIFGSDYNATHLSSFGSSHTNDDVMNWNQQKQQQQQHAGAEIIYEGSDEDRISATHLLVEENTATPILIVYSLTFFAVSLTVVLLIHLVFAGVKYTYRRFTSSTAATHNNSVIRDDDDDDGNDDNCDETVVLCHLSQPLPGFELLPLHTTHLLVHCLADLAVVPFVTPRVLLIIWPAVELSLSILLSVFERITQHLSSGSFSIKIISRIVKSRALIASLIIAAFAFIFSILTTVTEHGLSWTAFWMLGHSILFLTGVRQLLVDKCLLYYYYDGASSSSSASKMMTSSSSSPFGMCLKYLQSGGGNSEMQVLFVMTTTILRALGYSVVLILISKFFRLIEDDALSLIFSFVMTELFSSSDSFSSLRFNFFKFVVFWGIIIGGVSLLGFVGGQTRQRNNNDNNNSKILRVFWTLIGNFVTPFDHDVNNHPLPSAAATATKNDNTSPSNNDNDNNGPRNNFQQHGIIHDFQRSSQRAGDKFTKVVLAVLLQGFGTILLFGYICPFLFSPPSTTFSITIVNHNVMIFVWILIAFPVFTSLNGQTLMSGSGTFYLKERRNESKMNKGVGEKNAEEEEKLINNSNSIIINVDEDPALNFGRLLLQYKKQVTALEAKINDQEQQRENGNDLKIHNNRTPASKLALIKHIFREIWSVPHERRLLLFFFCTLSFMFVEFYVGTSSNSLGLISDAFHMLIDSSSILIGLIACYAAKWPPTKKHPFGFGKYEALSGMLNGILLIVVSIHIVHEAYHRVEKYRAREVVLSSKNSNNNNFVIDTHHVIPVSFAGLVLNVVGIIFFHDQVHRGDESHKCGEKCALSGCTSVAGSHHNDNVINADDNDAHKANMQGVFLHILADLLGSVAVVSSSLIISYFPSWYIVDPLCAVVVSSLILMASWSLMSSTYASLVC